MVAKQIHPRWIVESEKLPEILRNDIRNLSYVVNEHRMNVERVCLTHFKIFFEFVQWNSLGELFARQFVPVNQKLPPFNRAVMLNAADKVARRMLPAQFAPANRTVWNAMVFSRTNAELSLHY